MTLKTISDLLLIIRGVSPSHHRLNIYILFRTCHIRRFHHNLFFSWVLRLLPIDLDVWTKIFRLPSYVEPTPNPYWDDGERDVIARTYIMMDFKLQAGSSTFAAVN